MLLSNLRRVVLAQLAKAWRFGLDVPASRLVTVFKLNGALTYRFLRELELEGVVERVGGGRWRLRDTIRARALAEYALELWIEKCKSTQPTRTCARRYRTSTTTSQTYRPRGLGVLSTSWLLRTRLFRVG